MPGIKIEKTTNFELAWRRFKRACEKAGIFGDLRKRQYREKPTAARKRKAAAAVKRNQKRIAKDREALGQVRRPRRARKKRTTTRR